VLSAAGWALYVLYSNNNLVMFGICTAGTIAVSCCLHLPHVSICFVVVAVAIEVVKRSSETVGLYLSKKYFSGSVFIFSRFAYG
jgi:hypothetical protein